MVLQRIFQSDGKPSPVCCARDKTVRRSAISRKLHDGFCIYGMSGMYRTFQSLPMRNRIQPQNRTRLRFRLLATTTFVLVLIASALMLVFQFGDSEESRAGVAANETMTTGSFIINMGVTPQTTGNGLKPYGMIYDLIRNYSVPVKWVIDPAKTRMPTTFRITRSITKAGRSSSRRNSSRRRLPPALRTGRRRESWAPTR